MKYLKKKYKLCPTCKGHKYINTWKHGLEKADRRTCPLCKGSGQILEEK